VAALETMNADVVGLMEMENDGGAHQAIGDLVAGLNDAMGAGTYAYIDTGVVGTDEIRVALIFKPSIVSPVGSYAILDSSVDPTFIDTRNRPVLAQTFSLNSNGEAFTVVVNHLKSKGSGCEDIGDPDTGDGQGNCNLTRLSAVEAETNWLATDPTGSGDPDFLIIGDMNSYAMEDPIAAFEDAGYTNLIASFIGPDAYSFVFQGQSGYLDHAIASASMVGQATDVTEWHINADEPIALDYNVEFKSPGQITSFYSPDAYRSSDHDPVLIGLSLIGQPASITITAGDNQSTTVGTDFPTQLSLTLYDAANQPVPNATVIFTPPAAGASATTVGPYVTDANGSLSVTATANTVAGSYQVVASSGTASANFNLSNTPGSPATITKNGGDNQSTVVDTDFPTQLDLTVYDTYGNPVPQATVTFAGPVSGASASIVESGPYSTNSGGSLVVTAHANTTAGSYSIVATSGTATASFNLTNLLSGLAQLSPGGSSCAAFVGETAPTLSQITYTVNKDKINGLSEGTFSYWLQVVAPVGDNTFTVTQQVTTGNFSVLHSLSTGSNAYKSDCTAGLKPTITQNGGIVTVQFNAPVAGTYYIALKFSTSPIKGNSEPSPTTVTYQFSTALVADSTRSVDLVKQ
jgi:hypothetical protein